MDTNNDKRCYSKEDIRLFTGLLSMEICGGKVPEGIFGLSDEGMEKILSLAKSQDMAHIVVSAFSKIDTPICAAAAAKYKKHCFTAVFRYEKLNRQIEKVTRLFADNSIPYVLLKGTEIRKLYPEPWMRTSCDIDILIPEELMEKAGGLLSGELKYTIGDRGNHDVGYYSEDGVHLELHYSLMEKRKGFVDEYLFKNTWDYAKPLEAGGCQYLLNDDFFYYYHVAHMAKHILNGGCGVRPLLDLYLLNRREDYNKEARESLLLQGKLLDFSRHAELLSEVWFGEAAHTDITAKLEWYIVNSGIYGTKNNSISILQAKRGGRFSYLLKNCIWLPYDSMRLIYPRLEKQKFLLPAYEVARWFNIIFRKGPKHINSQIKINAAGNQESVNSTSEFINSIGL